MGKIITQCEHCNQKMNVDEEFVGKKIRCPNCKNTFPIKELNPKAPSGIKQVTPPAPPQEDDEIEKITEEFIEETPMPKPAPKAAPSVTAKPVDSYNEPKFCVFKDIVPQDANIIGEYNLGSSGWIVPEGTKVLVTENEVYVRSARRYIFGIFPGGKKIGTYPIESFQMRTGILKYTSIFAMFLFLIFGLAIGLGAWFVAKTAGAYADTDKMYCLKTMFNFDEQKVETEEVVNPNETTPENDTPATAKPIKQDMMKNIWAFIQMAWYYLIPFAIAFIWVLIFWRSRYKTCLFNVSISRCRKKEAQACLCKINEQALRIAR